MKAAIMDEIELTETRPPSVASSFLSHSTNRTKSGYHRMWDNQEADDFPFSVHNIHSDPIGSFNARVDPQSEPLVDFDPSWAHTPRKNQRERHSNVPRIRPLLWTPHMGGNSHRQNISSQSDRPPVLNSFNEHFPGNSERLNKYRPKQYQPSFCEESAPQRIPERPFVSPWAEKVRKPKPFMFSPIEYSKLTRDNSACSSRYSSAGTLDGRPPSRQGRRPVTDSTRPVTVEACHDLNDQAWKQ